MAVVITNVGLAFQISKLRGTDTTTYPQWVGWGTGTGTSAKTDTDIFTPASEARVQATLSAIQTTVTGDTFQAVALLTATAAKNITNAGLFTASTAGTLYEHGDHASVPVDVGDGINYTFQDAHS